MTRGRMIERTSLFSFPLARQVVRKSPPRRGQLSLGSHARRSRSAVLPSPTSSAESEASRASVMATPAADTRARGGNSRIAGASPSLARGGGVHRSATRSRCVSADQKASVRHLPKSDISPLRPLEVSADLRSVRQHSGLDLVAKLTGTERSSSSICEATDTFQQSGLRPYRLPASSQASRRGPGDADWFTVQGGGELMPEACCVTTSKTLTDRLLQRIQCT